QIPPHDSTINELELWYAGEDSLTLDILDPDGKFVTRVSPGEKETPAKTSQGLLSVYNRLKDPNNHANTITVFFESGLPPGVWTLRLYGRAVRDGRFHAWIERDERGQSRFVPASDGLSRISDDCTLSSLACGHQAIVVGSYDAHATGSPL